VAGRCWGLLAPGFRARVTEDPLATFATDKPSKEAHDSEVLVTQCRRTRRSRCGNPQRRPATRATTTKPRFVPRGQASRSPPLDELPRDDGVGFLSNVTGEARGPARNDGGLCLTAPVSFV
jgi:hypothetical protein